MWSFRIQPVVLCVFRACLFRSGATQNLSQLLENVPSCALKCLVGDPVTSLCSINDFAGLDDCICTNFSLQSEISSCVQIACPYAQQVQTADFSNGFCSAFPTESRSREVKITAIATAIAVIVAVTLRFVARFVATNQLWWDDWTILAGTVVFLSAASLTLVAANLGFGKHYWTVNHVDAPISLKIFYTTQILYIFLVVLPKVSILILFCRIFPSRKFRRVATFYVVFIVFHGVLFLFLVIFQCTPIEAVWKKEIIGKCLDITATGWAGAGITILEDIAILLLPIPELRKLVLSLPKKLGVFFMFSIGSFACVASMVRLKYMVHFAHTLDTTWENVDVVIWSLIEISLAIICGSLPALRPLILKIRNQVKSWFSFTTEVDQQSGATDSSSRRLALSRESKEEHHELFASRGDRWAKLDGH